MSEHAHSLIVRCERRQQWRDWLAGHFESESEVWFVFPTKDSGEEGVSYNDTNSAGSPLGKREARTPDRTSRGSSGWMLTG